MKRHRPQTGSKPLPPKPFCSLVRPRPLLLAVLFLAGCTESPTPLIKADQIERDTIPASLTGQPGDAARGRSFFAARDSGHCVLCHVVSSLDEPFQGNLGPDLSNVGSRLSPAQIRLRIVDASRLNPETVMPPYYRVAGLTQVMAEHEGEPVLSPDQIEDVVAYLSALKDAAP